MSELKKRLINSGAFDEFAYNYDSEIADKVFEDYETELTELRKENQRLNAGIKSGHQHVIETIESPVKRVVHIKQKQGKVIHHRFEIHGEISGFAIDSVLYELRDFN